MSPTPNPSFAELEKSGWSEPETARAYAEDFAKAAEYSVPVMLDAVRAGPGRDLLDLCCGHGILSAGAVARGANVTGLDFSPAMLEMARARLPGVTFAQGDAMQLDLSDAQFDAVVVGFGIPHVPDPEQAGAMQYMFQAIAAQGAQGIALPPGPGAHDYADADRAGAALNAAGFGDVELTEVDSRWTIDSPDQIFQFFHPSA